MEPVAETMGVFPAYDDTNQNSCPEITYSDPWHGR